MRNRDELICEIYYWFDKDGNYFIDTFEMRNGVTTNIGKGNIEGFPWEQGLTMSHGFKVYLKKINPTEAGFI